MLWVKRHRNDWTAGPWKELILCPSKQQFLISEGMFRPLNTTFSCLAMVLAGMMNCILLTQCHDQPHPEEHLFPARLEGLFDDGDSYGYINVEGKVRIKAVFNDATSFSDGVAFAEGISVKPGRFGPGWAWGLIRQDGNWLVRPGLLEVDRVDNEQFVEGLCAIAKDHRWGYIDKSGRFKIQPIYDFADSFSDGLAAVEKDERDFYINSDGVPQFSDKKWEHISTFHHGLAVVRSAAKEGVIDTRGVWVLTPKYDLLNQALPGKFLFAKRDEAGLVAADGKVLLQLPKKRVGFCTEGMAEVQIDGKWGALNLEDGGKLTVPALFQQLDEFSEGLAAFEKDGASGYVDKTGKIVIDLGTRYETCDPFHHGLAYLRKTGVDEGYVNKQGKWVFRRKLKG